MQKLASFDIEIAKILPEGEGGTGVPDWVAERPLGISCAALCGEFPGLSGVREGVMFYYNQRSKTEPISKPMARVLVKNMIGMSKDEDYLFVTVNGAGFDFDILAEESGMTAECADLALNHHCDLMLMSVCHLGWRTGLDALAKGAGVESKLKSVTLTDGRILEGMDGAKAPEMWAAGEYEAVLAYLAQDVKCTLETAEVAIQRGGLSWTSSTGKYWSVPLRPLGKLPTVAEMLKWPGRDTSWMDNPPNKFEIVKWALEALGVR